MFLIWDHVVKLSNFNSKNLSQPPEETFDSWKLFLDETNVGIHGTFLLRKILDDDRLFFFIYVNISCQCMQRKISWYKEFNIDFRIVILMKKKISDLIIALLVFVLTLKSFSSRLDVLSSKLKK